MDSQFLYMVCQVGAEQICKEIMESQWPGLRLSFSRPGFLTYKMDERSLPAGVDLKNPFARTHGLFLGRLTEGDDAVRAQRFWELTAGRRFSHVHVWQRDTAPVGDNFEPTISEAAERVRKQLRRQRPKSHRACRFNRICWPGDEVVDCVVVDPDLWWIGYHQAATMHQRWPGGTPPIQPPAEMISRAYLKMREGLWWSRLPIRKGDVCVEIGSAPGGSCQALLEKGLRVVGVDPAEMDPALENHPNFIHLRKRAREVKRRNFADARWLFVDANVTPPQTLDIVDDIVTHSTVHIQGLLLTLKLPQWELVHELSSYLERVRSWGFSYVRPRQLAFNRQEISVLAVRRKSLLHNPGQRKKARRKTRGPTPASAPSSL